MIVSEQEVRNSVAQRIIIKFIENERFELSEIFVRLQEQLGKASLLLTRVYDLVKIISRRWTTYVKWTLLAANQELIITLINDNSSKNDEIVCDERQITVAKLWQNLGNGVGSPEGIFVAIYKFLQRFENEGENIIIMCDEIWAYYYAPEYKRANM